MSPPPPASTALEGAVELLERSLAYTRGTLGGVRPDLLGHATPCVGWDLARLLAHMEDALDAFTEAAAGVVVVDPPAAARGPVETLREKACVLLGAWVRATPAGPVGVGVGGRELASPVLVATAALEITVHGWDVAQATGARTPVPADLARGLLGVARAVVTEGDRRRRFASPRPCGRDASYDELLLAFLGRRLTGPPGGKPAVRDTGGDLAS